MCRTEDEGGRKVNRNREDGASVRRVKKILGKSNWFKNKKMFTKEVDGKQMRYQGGAPVLREMKHCGKQARGSEKERKETEAVVFVACTPGVAL